MNLRRTGQVLLTSFLGQGVTVINQLLIPPFFLRFYNHGVAVYGEWNVLSASVNYLGTLNYGVQTYSTNEMTILYNRGDVEGAKVVQASALRLLLLLIAAFATFGLVVFIIPVSNLLKLQFESPFVASLTLYFLIMQIAVNMLFALLTNNYMVVGLLHRGNYWGAAQRLFMILSMAVTIWFRCSLAVLAGVQLASYVIFLIIVIIDVRIVAPILLPSLKYGDWKHVKAILVPSGHFGLIAIAGFLTWQAPTILIQRVMGPTAVGIFALVRTVFQMSRQILSIASNTIAQDITTLFGQKDWKMLSKLYDFSERIVLFLIPLVTIGSAMMCPFLFTVWLHKRDIYQPELCLLMAIVSAVLGIKEHKTQFQSSSNKHERLSIPILIGYSVMLLVSIFTMKIFGLIGFILPWLIWEIIQTAFVLRLNALIFPEDYVVNTKPILKLAVFMSIAFALAAPPMWWGVHWSLWEVVAVAVTVTGIFSVAAYFVFGVDEMRSLLTARLRNRFATR